MNNEDAFLKNLCDGLVGYEQIPAEYYEQYNVKRGLRNADGTGVVAGCTKVCNVHGYLINEGERVAHEGELTYRGYNVAALIEAYRTEDRFGFEEVAFLLLFGKLPNKAELKEFRSIMDVALDLPEGFTEDMVMKAPSRDIMNKLASSVLALYGYDDAADDLSLPNVVRQCTELIARIPVIAVEAYQVRRRHFEKKSLFFHYPQPGLSVAENILYMLRADRQYTDAEAKLLDLCLILHMEHGGGNNSTFVSRMLTSTGTDTYSALAGAICSLKGPRHGGANAKVCAMVDEIAAALGGDRSDEAIGAYLEKIVRKEAGDGTGLIYGMGHAVYTISDPRAVMLRKAAKELAAEKGMEKEFALIESIERLAPEVFRKVKGTDKPMCANVDLYSGFVYRMLGIPEELFTPLFASARSVGWSAHRIEELITGNRIIRPAYKAVFSKNRYLPPEQR